MKRADGNEAVLTVPGGLRLGGYPCKKAVVSVAGSDYGKASMDIGVVNVRTTIRGATDPVFAYAILSALRE